MKKKDKIIQIVNVNGQIIGLAESGKLYKRCYNEAEMNYYWKEDIDSPDTE